MNDILRDNKMTMRRIYKYLSEKLTNHVAKYIFNKYMHENTLAIERNARNIILWVKYNNLTHNGYRPLFLIDNQKSINDKETWFSFPNKHFTAKCLCGKCDDILKYYKMNNVLDINFVQK